jgi:ribulose-phosphate 3-epimerase
MTAPSSSLAATFPLYPSLLSFDFARLGEQVAVLEAAGAAGLHFDMMDGQFVPNLTFGPMVLQAVKARTALPCWAHLMVYRPEELIPALADAGAARVYIHPEATPHVHRVLGLIKQRGMEAGIAINPGTPITSVEPVLDLLDGILMMSVNPGFGGQAFIPSTLLRLRELRALLDRNGVTPDIECDGGVDASTLPPLIAAGMTGAVVGAALFRDGEPAVTLQALQRIADGVF